jgi:predicted chitinase
LITRDRLARMFPRALPEWIDALERLAPQLLAHYKFNRLDWCGLCGQIDSETDGLALRRMQENMSFTASRMLEVYSKRLGDAVGRPVPPLDGRVFASKHALARALAGKPKELADVVYGGPWGREGTPPWQGSRYIGRGPLQETHRNNYAAARDEIRKQPGGTECPDLVEQPELLATDPELGVRNVFGQWKTKGLTKYAQKQDWATLSDVLNTGNPNDSVKPHGLQRRLRATARALAIWPADEWDSKSLDDRMTSEPAPVAKDGPRDLRQGHRGDDVKALQTRLAALGYASGPADGVFGVLTTRAVIALQAEHKLTPDGVVGARTREVLAITAPAEGAHTNITAADLTGSSTISALRWGKGIVAGFFGINAGTAATEQLGLGIVDSVVSQGEKVKSLGDRIAALGLPVPSPAMLWVMALGIVCALIWHFLNKAEAGRVKAAQRGG